MPGPKIAIMRHYEFYHLQARSQVDVDDSVIWIAGSCLGLQEMSPGIF